MSVSAEFVLRKKVAEDPAISPRAKALFFYILCQNREKFVFFRERILKALGCCKPAYLKACKELIDRQLICTVQFREKGRVRGLRILIIGIDNIQDANSNTAVSNTAVSNTAVSNIDHIRRSINKKVKEKEGKGEECSPALSNDEQNEIEVVCQDKNKTADAVTHMPPETHTFSSSETKTDVRNVIIDSAKVPTVNDFVQAINDSLNEKGLIWGATQIQYKAEKLHSYYASKNWINRNGKQITSINVPHLVRYCLTRDKFQPEEVKLKFTPQAQSGGSCIDKLVFSLLDEAFDKSEREKAEKEERHRLFLLEQQRKREEYLKEHQNA